MINLGMKLAAAILLVTAVSIDAFVASFAYGADKIKIPFTSAVVINGICSGVLIFSLLIGSIVRNYIDPWMAKSICFAILVLLGVVKLGDSAIKAVIRNNKWINRSLSFSAFHLRFILQVYADPSSADLDASKTLSIKEAVSLAIALSLDGFAVGFGAGLADMNILMTLILSFLVGLIAIMGGCYFGRKATEKLKLDLSWLGGALLILLAVQKIH